MPFPWKKNRVTRISQIVADLQSPKRGGSLVVETGFPTSLIDLFVKNRSRFQKHRSKKPLQQDFPDPPPSPAASPPPMPQTEEPVHRPAPPVRANECGSGSGLNVLIMAKILVAMVLVASVTRLTVGITVSAFALLFLEYAGKRVVSCSDCVWFQKLLLLLLPLVVRLKAKTERAGVVGAELSYESLSIEEIEVVEARSEIGIRGELEDDGDDSSEGKVLEAIEVSECKIRGSRSGRFRSKMVKKLVPKKFRSSSKKEKKEKGLNKQNEVDSGSEFSSAVEEDNNKLSISEIDEVEEEDGGFGKEKGENGNFSIKKTKLECIKDDYGDDQVDNRVGNSSSLILVIVALVGLLVGRFQALVLSIACCCLLKMVNNCLLRSPNVSLIKCSVPNS